MSQIKVDSIVPRNGIASGEGGGIIQVVTTNISARTTVSGLSNTAFTDISGFSKAITLTSNTSKALIMIMLNVSHQSDGFAIPAFGYSASNTSDSPDTLITYTVSFLN